MEEKMLKQNITRLDIKDNLIDTLKENNINNIGELCKRSKKDLKHLGILSNQADKIEIELQLLGLNLKNSL